MPAERKKDLASGAQKPEILPAREQSERITELVRARLDTLTATAMAEDDLDMWLILCQEDDLDPIYKTMIPMDCWCPILQMLVFVRESDGSISRYNISGTNTADLFQRPYTGQIEAEQWPILVDLVKKRKPNRIGIHTGSVAWAAGGLTHNLHRQLLTWLPAEYHERLVPAEATASYWGSILTDSEIELLDSVVDIALWIIEECYSRRVITPGSTTTDDLVWTYWQLAIDLGLDLAFRPYFRLIRSDRRFVEHGQHDSVIRPGDAIHCDVGIRYMRLNSDHQRLAYVLEDGESAAPQGLRALMGQTNRLQDTYMGEFRTGITGNQLLKNILENAGAAGIQTPRVYSHSVGLFLHQPGPLIGLPWDQTGELPRGEVIMRHNTAYTMELSTEGPVPEWDGQTVRMPMEEMVVFTERGCSPVRGRQTEFYLV